VTKLVAKAQERGCLDRRDPSGVSAFLHWCGSGCTPNVLQLCLDHGADIDQVDIDGNTALHKLVASSNFRALDALAKHGQDGDARALGSGFLCRPWWCLRNNAGLTVAQLASHRTHTEQGRSVQYLLQCAQRDWEEGGRPLLLRQLERVMHLHDVADLALQYIDGSGRAFSLPPAAAEENMEEVAEGAVVPPAAIALDAPAAAAGEGGAAGGAAAGGGGGGGANPALALDAEEIEEGDPFDGEPFSDDDEEDEELDLEDAGNIL
jgi:ankyrin repeat protein